MLELSQNFVQGGKNKMAKIKCVKGNLYKLKKGKGRDVLILSKTKKSAMNRFKRTLAYKYGEGKINVKLIERNKLICK